MMCIVNLDEYTCDCHLASEVGLEVMHCMPCCAGPCNVCGMYVRLQRTEEHHQSHLYDPDHLNPAEGGNKAGDDYW